MGVFATRSPHRPCPIGLTVAKVWSNVQMCTHDFSCNISNGSFVINTKRRIFHTYIPMALFLMISVYFSSYHLWCFMSQLAKCISLLKEAFQCQYFCLPWVNFWHIMEDFGEALPGYMKFEIERVITWELIYFLYFRWWQYKEICFYSQE